MISVYEYKPPHKLKSDQLRAGLRPMHVYEQVVKRKTVPTSDDPPAHFRYWAERLALCRGPDVPLHDRDWP